MMTINVISRKHHDSYIYIYTEILDYSYCNERNRCLSFILALWRETWPTAKDTARCAYTTLSECIIYTPMHGIVTVVQCTCYNIMYIATWVAYFWPAVNILINQKLNNYYHMKHSNIPYVAHSYEYASHCKILQV